MRCDAASVRSLPGTPKQVNKYSSLTAGATVYIEVDGVELPLLVKVRFRPSPWPLSHCPRPSH